VGLPPAASSSKQSPNAVPSSTRSSSHSYFSPSTASCCPHQRVRNQIQTAPVPYEHIQSNILPEYNLPLEHTTCRCLRATAGQLQGSTEHCSADVNGSGLVFNPPRSTAPFLSATIVLNTILHRCSTPRTCTHIAVRNYSTPSWHPIGRRRTGPKFTDDLRTILRQFSDLRQSYDNWQVHRTFTTIVRPILKRHLTIVF